MVERHVHIHQEIHLKPKKIGVLFILAWFFGVIAIISGAINLINSIVGGLMVILGGIIIVPLFAEIVEKKTHIKFSGFLRFVIFLILVIWGTAISPQGLLKDDNTTNSDIPTEEAFTEIKIFALGEEFIVDDISFRVNKITKKVLIGNSYFGIKPNGVFYTVDLIIENKDKESKSILMEQFKIIDNQDRIFDYDIEAEIYEDNSIRFGEQLQPGLPISGVKVFDLPRDAEGLKLEITCCGFVSEKAQVDLGI